jgi:hypothetical protein
LVNEALRHDLGHDLIGVVNALAPVKAQRESERSGKVARIGGREFFVVHTIEHRSSARTKKEQIGGFPLRSGAATRGGLQRRVGLGYAAHAMPFRTALILLIAAALAAAGCSSAPAPTATAFQSIGAPFPPK